MQSGTIRVRHNDGTEQDVSAGDAHAIEPGHEDLGRGRRARVGFEFESKTAEEYAKPS